MISSLLILVAAILSGDWAIAQADRDQFPPEVRPYLYYSGADHLPDGPDRRDAQRALRLAVAQISPQEVIERCTPIPISPTVMRFNLLDMGFRAEDWAAMVQRDPYRPVALPMLSRADWLLLQLSDTTTNPDSYYRLVFGGARPKTRNEALTLLGVDLAERHRFGLIEAKSGVSVQGVRWIENLPIARGYAYGTRDVLTLKAHQDPAEQPEGDFQHDAEEWIIGRRKFRQSDGAQGCGQVYLLADGKGNLVEFADPRIVEDHQSFRGNKVIENVGACIQCHAVGTNPFTLNELRHERDIGIERWSKSPTWDQIQRFHFADVAPEIERDQERFAIFVKGACDCIPADAADSFRRATERYDQDVDLSRMAAEHYIDAWALQRALALESGAGNNLPVRVVGLAHGDKMPRPAAEEAWPAIHLVVEKWLRR